MDVVTVMQRQWKRDGDGNEWLGDGRISNGRQWMARQWTAWQWTAWQLMARGLGYGRLDGNAMAMVGLSARRRRWGNSTAMNGSTAMAMNGLAADGSAMDGAMVW